MFCTDNGANDASRSRCSAFHTPAVSATRCSPSPHVHRDGDSLAIPSTTAPLVANESQADSDGDGIGTQRDGRELRGHRLSGRVDASTSLDWGGRSGPRPAIRATTPRDLDMTDKWTAPTSRFRTQFGK